MPQRRAAHLSQIRTKSLLRHGQSTENSDVSQPLVLNAPLGVNNEGTETDSIAEDDTENKFQKPCKALNNKNSADCSTVSDGYSNLNYSQQERLKLDTNPVSSSSESDFESPAFLNRRQHRQTTCCRDKGKSLHHSAQTSNTTASKEAKAAYSSTNKKPKKESVQQRILRLHPELGTGVFYTLYMHTSEIPSIKYVYPHDISDTIVVSHIFASCNESSNFIMSMWTYAKNNIEPQHSHLDVFTWI